MILDAVLPPARLYENLYGNVPVEKGSKIWRESHARRTDSPCHDVTATTCMTMTHPPNT
jgi:hypothetical protein